MIFGRFYRLLLMCQFLSVQVSLFIPFYEFSVFLNKFRNNFVCFVEFVFKMTYFFRFLGLVG